VSARIPLAYWRGGTSKAAMFLEKDLPSDPADRDRALLAIMGGPDPAHRQLNGLGGGTSSTSKVAIIGPASGCADVTFLFAQVGIDRPTVDYTGTCGNISAAVAPFAIEHGLVTAIGAETAVRVLNSNTGTSFLARVVTRDGRFDPIGDYEIGGVAGSGSRIRLEFVEPSGAVTGRLLPTGQTSEFIDGIEVSVVDAANPVVFLRGADLGLSPEAAPADLAGTPLLDRLERIRQEASVRAGIALAEDAADTVVPRIAIVATDARADVRALMISAGRPHPAYPFTGAIAAAVATRIPGSVVASVARPSSSLTVVVRHPAGVIELEIDAQVREGELQVAAVTSSRTARELMRGWTELSE
jgi:2-methylaconitate cis-trans-isomerase PrpF